MVFESFVDDLIKKYLGDYVEKCDPEISIPKGYVILKNLVLKENALDAFDLPVKIKTGHIQRITLLIQWTNLYTKPLDITIDGVYVLAVPNVAGKNNEENEEKAKQKSKQKKIKRIEDAIKLDAERDQHTSCTSRDRKTKPKKDSFSEKMAAHIIKNLEIKVTNVHVRYEDKYTNPKHPFAIGLSLKELHLKTTDEKWKECSVKESVTQIFKLVKMDSLAVYWNVDLELFESSKNCLLKLANGIADREKEPGFQYLIRRISPEAKLSLNTKPELNNFRIPKISLTTSMDDISVEISKLQFNSALEMIESFKGVKLLRKNKEKRPDRPIKTNVKQWWHYAGNSICHDIRRRQTMWSWRYIESHRINMKQYKDAYVKKLKEKKINEDLQERLDNYEKDLNVLSIIIMRQQAEVEASKHRITQEKRNRQGGREKKSNALIESIKNEFQEKFTADEKAKLYNAIGYEENHSDITLPNSFIAERLEISFTKMTLSLKDTELNDQCIINFQLEDVSSSFGHRPAANAVQVEAKVQKYTVEGTLQNGKNPVMALSQTVEVDDKNALLDVWFETNPLDGDCDTRLRIKTRHIEFIYDAVTVNNLARFAKPPHNVDVQQLSKTALGTFEAMKKYSATGLRHAIDQTKFTEISVDIQPSYVIIPNNGYYKKGCRALIIDLGNLKVCTKKRQPKVTELQQRMTKEELMKQTYDRFDITLDRLQILFSSLGEEWRVCRKQSQSDMHILEPIKVNVVLQKFMFDKDLTSAKMIMSGELPLLSFNVSDQRLHDLIKLANSIPLPESALIPKREILLAMSMKHMKMKDAVILATARSIKSKQSQSPNYRKMEISFVIKQVDINISQKDKKGKTVQEVRLVVASLGTKAAVHTYAIDVEAYLGGINIQHTQFMKVDCHVVNLVNTPSEDGSKKLMQLHYIKTKKNGQNNAAAYSRIEQEIDVSFTNLQLLLHQEALLHVLELVENLKLASKETKQTEIVTSTTQGRKDRQKTDKKVVEKKKTPFTRKRLARLMCKLKIKFEIESLSTTLYVAQNDLMAQRSHSAAISTIQLQNIVGCGKQMSDKSMKVNVSLKDIVLDDSRLHKINGITRMIQRRESRLSEEESSNMINVIYKQDSSGDSNVDVRIHSLYICVCLDYLTSIGNFVNKCKPKKEQRESGKQKIEQRKANKKEEKPSTPSYYMDVVVKIENPEIILIEDQLNPNCNCLVLNTEVDFKMNVQPESQDMSAEVEDIQIFSCVFSNRETVAAQILNNCKLSLESKTLFDRGAEMRIETSNLIFNISPSTIKTISRICTGLSAKPHKKSTKETYKVPADLWEIKSLSNSDFWFLKSTDYLKKKQSEHLEELTEEVVRPEQLTVNIPSMVIQLEGGVGLRTVPLIKSESSINVDVKNWSSKLSIEGTLKLEVAYHNEKLSVWEPLLEPLIDDGKEKRWELGLEVKINDDLPSPSEGKQDILDKISLPPKMTITAFSHDDMQLTLSKTCIEVLHNLNKAFGDAYMLVEPSVKAGEILSPFCIQNRTGLDVVITLDDSLEMPEDSHDFKVKVTTGRKLQLWNKKKKEKDSEITTAQEGDEKTFNFCFEKVTATQEVTVKRAEKRLYQINKNKHGEEALSFIVKTETPIGQKKISIQSIIQIKNHFQEPLEVYYVDDTTKLCGAVAPDTFFSIPLTAVYTRRGEFQFKPESKIYRRSSSISWKDAKKFDTVQRLKCEQISGGSPFYISVKVEVESVYFDVGDTMSAKSYVFHLSPTVILTNLLPYPVMVHLEGIAEQTTLQKGQNTALVNASVGDSWLKIVIPMYKGKEWIGKRLIRSNFPEQSTIKCEAKHCTLNLGLHCQEQEGCLEISVYSPYWMVNKTGKDLYYKATDEDSFVTHEHENLEIVMFSFEEKIFFSNTTEASMKMTDCEWSDKFSLEKVGKPVTVQCKSKKQTFTVKMQITMSSSGFTKMCTFTPFYMLMNTSKFTIECQEVNQEENTWITVLSKEFKPFWPVQSGKNLAMKARFLESVEETSQFYVNETHTTLMKLSKQYGGLNVDCQMTDTSIVVTFGAYMDGMATVLLVNHTETAMVHFHQRGVEVNHYLNAQHYMLYTWEDATGVKEVVWSCGNKQKQGNDLHQDGMGEFHNRACKKVYWVSFLNGIQRTLLFTEDHDLVKVAQETGELERVELEIIVCIQGLGLSLVNNDEQKEVAYLSVTSSGILWEDKSNNCTTLNDRTTEILEKSYQHFSAELWADQNPPSRVRLEEEIEVDWNEMMMIKPYKIGIRRGFRKGIWLQYKTSPHQIKLHANIQRVQFDNQMSDAIFQTVLAPIAPAKSTVAEASEPFTKLRILAKKSNHSNILQFKSCKLISKDMEMKVDLRFINELYDILSTSESNSRHNQTILMEKDYKKANAVLKMDTNLSIANKHLYDHISILPININLCFSSQGCGGDGIQKLITCQKTKAFLRTAGVVLANLQDVSLTLKGFEEKHKFYSLSEIQKKVIKHFKSKVKKKCHIIVFGSDVLGNPVKLIQGSGKKSNQRSIEGHEGNLFGHAVDGVAESASSITGAIGKGIAALTFDDDFQKKRRQYMNKKRDANVTEGFARDGKGILKGVYHGVTGVVKKPIQGAKAEGVFGFFKGIGKGVVGVVTRPASGLIDFASGSFENITRINEGSVGKGRQRIPRMFSIDKIIRPYNAQEADGYMLLQDTEKGKFALSDQFIAHAVNCPDSTHSLIITDKRVIYARRSDILGYWNAEWAYTWTEMKETPKRTKEGIEIVLKEKESLFSFGKGPPTKDVHIFNPDTADFIHRKIKQSMKMQK